MCKHGQISTRLCSIIRKVGLPECGRKLYAKRLEDPLLSPLYMAKILLVERCQGGQACFVWGSLFVICQTVSVLDWNARCQNCFQRSLSFKRHSAIFSSDHASLLCWAMWVITPTISGVRPPPRVRFSDTGHQFSGPSSIDSRYNPRRLMFVSYKTGIQFCYQWPSRKLWQ